MNEADFRALVRKLRKAQREYFRTRDRNVLDASKAIEREVDAELETDTPGLFPEAVLPRPRPRCIVGGCGGLARPGALTCDYHATREGTGEPP